MKARPLSKKEISVIEAECQHLLTSSITTGILDMELEYLTDKYMVEAEFATALATMFERKQKAVKDRACLLLKRLGNKTSIQTPALVLQMGEKTRAVGLVEDPYAPVLNIDALQSSPTASLEPQTPETTSAPPPEQ